MKSANGVFVTLICLLSSGAIAKVALAEDGNRNSLPALNPIANYSLSSESGLSSKKEQAKVFWQSLLIPGLGQIASGRDNIGYAFLTTEIALVGSLIGLRVYADRMENDYRNYAAQHAGVSAKLDRQLYVDIGNWPDTRTYNEQRLRDRDYDALYNDPRYYWEWDSDASRSHFKTIRISSDLARNRALLVIGGLLLNHLASAIEAVRGADDNSLGVLPTSNNDGFMLQYSISR